jgi:hypothetical protein
VPSPSRLAPAAALALAAAALPARAGSDPAALAAAFCAAVRAGDETAAEALMTPELRAGVLRLRAADAAFRAIYPGEKPPLGDGLMLTGYVDYPESCTAEEADTAGAVLVYAPAGAPADVWRDRLVFAPGPDGGLLIAEILYAPDGAARFSDWLRESVVLR